MQGNIWALCRASVLAKVPFEFMDFYTGGSMCVVESPRGRVRIWYRGSRAEDTTLI